MKRTHKRRLNLIQDILNGGKELTDSWSNCKLIWYKVDESLIFGVTEYGEFIYGGNVFARLMPKDDKYILVMTKKFSTDPKYAICVSHWLLEYAKQLKYITKNVE